MTNLEAPKFKVGDRSRISKHKNNFSKGYTKNWLKQFFVIDCVLENNPWKHKIKD